MGFETVTDLRPELSRWMLWYMKVWVSTVGRILMSLVKRHSPGAPLAESLLLDL